MYTDAFDNTYTPNFEDHPKRKDKRTRACLWCCCILFCFLLIIGAAVATFFLWIRIPTVKFNGVEQNSKSAVEFEGNMLRSNWILSVTVDNPNFFDINFDRITIKGFHPLMLSTPIGTSELRNISLKKKDKTTLLFPLDVSYDMRKDPKLYVLTDLAERCGSLQGDDAKQITLNYNVELAFSILAFANIAPTVTDSATFDCPMDLNRIPPQLMNFIPSLQNIWP